MERDIVEIQPLVEIQPPDRQVVLIWYQGNYSLAYLRNEVWYRYHQGSAIGAKSCVRWWMPLPPPPMED